jgi:hypothetical protein
MNTNRSRINILAVGTRLPTMHGFREYVEAGGLMSYGANTPDQFRRVADIVTDGRNVQIEYRWPAGNAERIRRYAGGRQQSPHVILRGAASPNPVSGHLNRSVDGFLRFLGRWARSPLPSVWPRRTKLWPNATSPAPPLRATNPVCKPGGRKMALYEMLHMGLYEVVIASGIAVVLVVATIGGLVARIMMGPEELALLRQAREMRVDMGDLTRRIGS